LNQLIITVIPLVLRSLALASRIRNALWIRSCTLDQNSNGGVWNS